MNPMQPTPAHQQERRLPAEVVAWRRQQLIDACFPEDLATGLAGDPRVDLHALLGLLDRGCPPELAARIMSPGPETVG